MGEVLLGGDGTGRDDLVEPGASVEQVHHFAPPLGARQRGQMDVTHGVAALPRGRCLRWSRGRSRVSITRAGPP